MQSTLPRPFIVDAKINERFWSRVDVNGPVPEHDPELGSCWVWKIGLTSAGYSQITVGKTRPYCHRLVEEAVHGPIPDGMHVDHMCHVRRCVRPSHLRVTTPKQNQENRGGANRSSRSGHRGVSPDNRRGGWRVQITHNYRNHFVGRYDALEDAIQAYKDAQSELHTHYQ